MASNLLAINCGSSSIKFELFDGQSWTPLAAGLSEKIGASTSRQSYRVYQHDGSFQEKVESAEISNHEAGLQQIAAWLTSSGLIQDADELRGIAHRVAHGGPKMIQPTIIDDDVLATIRGLIPLAPLHNSVNVLGIELAMKVWPTTPQVAVFDTSFHHTIPDYAYRYALPEKLSQAYSIRRYGFHGTSHQYVAQEAACLLERPLDEINLIVLHLGNGASATAIKGGKSIDTSMGMTPLEGLMMGTRCGDIDPGIVLHLAQATDLSIAEIDTLLNKASGLLGICGVSDMREVVQRVDQDDPQAKLAYEMYCYRIKKYIGAYIAILPTVDAIVFTAGIGEHSADVRASACSNLMHLGICIDTEKNASRSDEAFAIHATSSRVKVLVIPTNEELAMAKQAGVALRSHTRLSEHSR